MYHSEKVQDTLYEIDDEMERCWPELVKVQLRYFARYNRYYKGGILEFSDGKALESLEVLFIPYEAGFTLIMTVEVDKEIWEKRLTYGPDESRSKPWRKIADGINC